MDIDELIRALEEVRIEAGEGTPVQVNLATGEGYPIASSVRGVFLQRSEDGDPTLWVVEGSQTDDPYSVPREAFSNYIS